MKQVYQTADGQSFLTEALAVEHIRQRAKHDLDYIITQMVNTHDLHRGTANENNPVGELMAAWRNISDELLDVIIYNGEQLKRRLKWLNEFNRICAETKAIYNNRTPEQVSMWSKQDD